MRSSTKPTDFRIAVDTGGTFTDCIWVERGRVRMLKVFSTPDDPSRAIADAIDRLCSAGDPPAVAGATRPRVLTLLHGTTVGTNTLLQRKGARVAFVTTKGFEDTIEIGRQARPKLYDFFFDKVEPLVPSDLRFGVPERISAEAEILRKPSRDHLKQLAETIRSQHPEAIAISTLFSFANPANEIAIAEALRSLTVPLSISHQLLPEFREYERASTVVVNAYLQPVMERYLTNLGRVVDAARPRAAQDERHVMDAARPRAATPATRHRVFVMQSSGGITSLATAAREPVRTVLSGPAGGVVGAAAMARRSGFDQIISFDMGGTSTDVALVSGELHTSNESEIAGLPVRVPMLDIHTVGAGGGSIARFDAGGALRVGPESAGASPGPICYGHGMQPTVTDANLLLGRLRPDRFLGGDFTLDLERTRTIITEWLKRAGSSMSVDQFAAGIIRVVNSTMEKAIRVVSIERGYDPRGVALVAFGGAGGLHACELAAGLGIST
ncbi:MAG: hydantoinase/oxoprolinase family protein, partial [Terriglobales bacterium]